MRMRLAALAALTGAALLASAAQTRGQSLEAGRKTFEQRCALCHGGDGEGGERGPAIASRLPALSDLELKTLNRDGRPLKGMPGRLVPDAVMPGLVKFLRALQQEAPPI